MNILVTGAGGYIGRHLVPRLRAEGHEVVSVYRSNWHRKIPNHYGFSATHDGAGEAWEWDLSHPFGGVLNDWTPHTVIHLAGRVDIALRPNPEGRDLPPIPGEQDIAALYRDNVLATANVLDYCLRAGVKHLVFASTQAVTGIIDSGPLEHYAASKLAAEQLLEIGAQRGQVVTILRLPGVYGSDRRRGAVWEMCQSALTREQIWVTAEYPLPYTAMHIEDVTGAIVQTVGAQTLLNRWVLSRLDITDGAPINLTILAQEIADLVLSGVNVVYPVVDQPICKVPISTHCSLEHWQPKPRRERLLQVLEEVRQTVSHQTGNG